MRLFSMYRWVRERHMIGIRGRNFLEAPWAGGVVLLGCVIVAMLLANLPGTSLYYRHLLETDLSLMVHSPDGLIDWVFPRGMTVEKLINDGLMVIFFFAVGLEIKREIVCGQLSSARQAILPVLAAAGGMLAPAIIFLFFNHGTIAANGWGIPTATDIAFAIGILSMLGDRVPVSLKIFLTALAIADDLGAILVIALFYGGQVQISCLLAALVIMLAVYFMKEMGEKFEKIDTRKGKIATPLANEKLKADKEYQEMVVNAQDAMNNLLNELDIGDQTYAAVSNTVQGIIDAITDKMGGVQTAVTLLNGIVGTIGFAGALFGGKSKGKPHAAGIDYVPYDGYPAILHKGERVQTAMEARAQRALDNTVYGTRNRVARMETMNNNTNNSLVVNVTVNGPGDGNQIADAVADRLRYRGVVLTP